VYRGWEKALKALGHEVMTYNTNDRLRFYGRAMFEDYSKDTCGECGQYPIQAAVPEPAEVAHLATVGLLETCYTFWPQVIFFVSAFFQTHDVIRLLRRRGHRIVMLHTESPYQDEEQLARGQYAHLNLLNDPTNIQQWRDLNVSVAYIPHSYDPDIHYPSEVPNYELDFAFIGTAFNSRCEFFSEMSFDGLDVGFGGNAWDLIQEKHKPLLRYLRHRVDECVDNTETSRIYRLARTGINFYRREGEDAYKGEGWAMGPREIEQAACGMFFVRDHRPESDMTFPMLPAFDTPQEAEELIRWYVAHDREREDAANRALGAIADWTFDNRAADVCGIMEDAGIL
jgi:spore maturation protein CgeB